MEHDHMIEAFATNGSDHSFPGRRKSAREFVNLHAGKIVDAIIRAIIPQTDGLR